jgi:hypothetical protein
MSHSDLDIDRQNSARQKLETILQKMTADALIDLYKCSLERHHGPKPDTSHNAEMRVVIRFTEAELDRRQIDCDPIIKEVLHR